MKKLLTIVITGAIFTSMTALAAPAQKIKAIRFVNKTPAQFTCSTYKQKLFGNEASITLNKRGKHSTGTIKHIGKNESWSCEPKAKKGFMTYSINSKFANKKNELLVTIAPIG
ncbi:MAG: hypothetical protein K0U29_07345 [Gammaproteobacteria bacterium]|nr:hypothetical protein [Gammaproteobacteria bacterium]MCH9744727.1 hypothetical protein [Gammaproteobacteria bacterium]